MTTRTYDIEAASERDANALAAIEARKDGIEPLRVAVTGRQALFGYGEQRTLYSVKVQGPETKGDQG